MRENIFKTRERKEKLMDHLFMYLTTKNVYKLELEDRLMWESEKPPDKARVD